MAYDYLKDGTPFVALELNDRLQAQAYEINNLSIASAAAKGGLGPQHLPSIVGRSGQATSSTNAWARPAVFSNVQRIKAKSFADNIIGPFTLGTPYRRDSASALIILFNTVIERFWYNDLKIGVYPRTDDGKEPVEDKAFASFTIQYAENPTGPWYSLPGSRRTVSPGQTINNIPMSGLNRFQQDDMSDKDVSIRAIIDLAELLPTSLDEIAAFRVECDVMRMTPSAILSPSGFSFDISKHNFTVIPIYGNVVESS